jgi:glycerol-3-phosphate acyltransferase PlsY
MPEFNLSFFVRLAMCYLLGSIPFAVVAMQGTGVNILKYGSGNPGFNNVLRYSKWRAVVTLLGDFGKGTLAIWLASQAGDSNSTLWIYGLAAILGHCYSPWLQFNGGKGIATSAGVMLYLYPLYASVVLVFFAGLRVLGSKRQWLEAGTIASLVSYALFVGVLILREDKASAAMGVLFLAFVTWRHKSNFQKLLAARGNA